MKKTLTLLMALVMMLSCFAGLSLNSSAAELEYVEQVYDYKTAMLDDYGKTDDLEIDDETGTYNSGEGFMFGGDLWTYEYYNLETEEFQNMVAYVKTSIAGYVPSFSSTYVPFGEVGFQGETGLKYLSIATKGTYLHPGTTSGPVVTFIVPASGKVSYDTSLFCGNAGGIHATIWLNDTMIFPADKDLDKALTTGDTHTKEDPFRIALTNVKVEEGDLLRLCITTPDGKRDGRGTTLVDQPKVTYTECVLPIGNPNGTPPSNVMAVPARKNSTDTDVSWDAALNAVSYNIYVKDSNGDEEAVKVNDAPITDTKYKITGLEFGTLYELTVTSITAEGKESAHSDPVGFMTAKGDGKTSDKTSDKDSDTTNTDAGVSQGGNNPVDNNKGDDAGFPWIIVVIAAAVVVVVAIVLVLVLGKKKKAVAAPVAEETVEAAPVAAPAEEPTEESPAEEKKDEE